MNTPVPLVATAPAVPTTRLARVASQLLTLIICISISVNLIALSICYLVCFERARLVDYCRLVIGDNNPYSTPGLHDPEL